ncbi:MAG TPA: tripartite tricarboxylate transporter substrate-binding protein, partial [Burkholderiales bacterium]|nr:tripartite tricarboxylate transporter substrate-binding protein [Burkholderiales bacterium]
MNQRTYGYNAAVAVLVASVFCGSAFAQTFPVKPIRLIVPYPPGGGTDFVARVVALKLPEIIGENVIVDNRPGAAGLVGTELAARAPADGYTLLLVDSSLPINVSYYKNAKYDALKDFDPITDVADTPYLLVVQLGSPYQSVRDVINAA